MVDSKTVDENPTHVVEEHKAAGAILAKRIRDLEATAVEHRVRLANGIEVFSELKKELRELARSVSASRRPNWWALIGFALTLLGGLWGLAREIQERPTSKEVSADVAERMREHGHPDLLKAVQEVRDAQVRLEAVVQAALQRGL